MPRMELARHFPPLFYPWFIVISSFSSFNFLPVTLAKKILKKSRVIYLSVKQPQIIRNYYLFLKVLAKDRLTDLTSCKKMHNFYRWVKHRLMYLSIFLNAI